MYHNSVQGPLLYEIKERMKTIHAWFQEINLTNIFMCVWCWNVVSLASVIVHCSQQQPVKVDLHFLLIILQLHWWKIYFEMGISFCCWFPLKVFLTIKENLWLQPQSSWYSERQGQQNNKIRCLCHLECPRGTGWIMINSNSRHSLSPRFLFMIFLSWFHDSYNLRNNRKPQSKLSSNKRTISNSICYSLHCFCFFF